MTKTSFEPSFDPCYVQGYTAALQDVLEVFANIQMDLKLHSRKQNYKTYKGIVECMLENRTILRETADSFVRCTDRNDIGYEIWREAWSRAEEENKNEQRV